MEVQGKFKVYKDVPSVSNIFSKKSVGNSKGFEIFVFCSVKT